MLIFIDDLYEEVVFQADDYPAPSPSGLNADVHVPSMTPTLPQADLATTLNDGSRGNLAQMDEPARDCVSTPSLVIINIAVLMLIQ